MQHEVSVEQIVESATAEMRSWLADRKHEIAHTKERGDFLLLICGDRIQPRLLDIARPMLDREQHVVSRAELGLVSLAVYEGERTTLVVPNVVGAIKTARRDLTITVHVETDHGPGRVRSMEVNASDERTDQHVRIASRGREAWTEETFFSDVRAQSAACQEDWPGWAPERGLRTLVTFAKTNAFNLTWGAGRQATFNVTIDVGGENAKALWVFSDGAISVHRARLAEHLGDAAATRSVRELLRSLGLEASAADGHTTNLPYGPWSSDDPSVDISRADHVRIITEWLVRLRDQIIASSK